MTLFLVQHGAAVAEEIDPDRPLTEQGRADVERLARFLGGSGVRADRVVHSGKTRARQTAEILAATVLPGGSARPQSGLKPRDSCVAFASGLRGLQETLMVVGHQPFLGSLAAYLATGREAPAVVAFKPGTLVALEEAPEGGWLIAAMIPPDLL